MTHYSSSAFNVSSVTSSDGSKGVPTSASLNAWDTPLPGQFGAGLAVPKGRRATHSHSEQCTC